MIIVIALVTVFAVWVGTYIAFVTSKARFKIAPSAQVSAVEQAAAPAAATSSQPSTLQSKAFTASSDDATANSLAVSNSLPSHSGRVLGASVTIANGTEQPIIQRIVESVRDISGVSTADLTALEVRINARINNIVSPPPFPQQVGGNGNGGGYVAASAASQRIDQLNNVTLNNPTIVGGSLSGTSGASAGIGNDATTTSLFSSVGHFAAGVIDALTTTAATIANLGTTELVATNATTSNLYVSGTAKIGSGTGVLQSNSGVVSAIGTGTNGQVLKIVGGVPAWGTDLTGSGGSSAWATTSDSRAVYATDPTQVVLVGTSATSTTGNILEVKGNTLLRGNQTTQGIATASSFAATSTATSTFGGGLSILNFAQTGSATSTGASGWNISAGCYAINNTCLSFTTLAGLISLSSQVTGTLPAGNGGTGSTTLSGILKGNGTSQVATAVGGTDYEFPLTFNGPLSRTGNAVSLSTSGDWSGTLSTFTAAQLISLGFSTTSADAWKSTRNFFATTSADYWFTQKTTDNLSQGATNKYYATSLFAVDLAATTTDALAQGNTNKYWSNTLFDNRLSATSSLPNIITLANLSLPAVQITNFGVPFYNFFHATTTDALAEGSFNLFFTNNRVASVIAGTTTTALAEGVNLYYTANRVAGAIAGTTTTALAEGTNLYFTNARADARVATGIAGTTTTALAEGSNLYFTNARADTRVASVIAGTTTDALAQGTTNKYYSSLLFASDFAATTTTALLEGTNLYFTNARAQSYLNAVDKGFFFSTTSASNFLTLNTGSAFSTTSAVYFADSSTTIPKTYSSNTFTNTNTFNGNTTLTNATSTNLGVTGIASSTNLVASNSFTFGKVTGFLKAVAGAVSTSLVNLASDVTGVLAVSNGGTGWAAVAAGAVPYGNGSGALATTTAGSNGQILALVNGVPSWVATTTLSTISGILGVGNGGTATSTFYSGGVVFSDSSKLTQSSAPGNLFWDEINRRLGIGTTSPAASLAVAGNAYIGGGPNSVFTLDSGVINNADVSTTTIPNNSPYAFTIATSTSAAPLFKIDTTASGPSVALGTPGSDVVIGEPGQSTNLVFEENSTIKGQGSGRTLTFGATNDVINFGVNVGIGTAAPNYALQTTSNTDSATFTGLTSAGFNGGVGIFSGATANNWRAIDFGTTGGLIARVGVQYTGGGSFIALGTSNNYSSGVTNQALTIDPSGNVGVGTTSPGTLLAVGGVANFASATSTFYSTGGINLGSGCFSVNGSCIGSGTGSGTVGSGAQGQFAFYNVAGTTLTATSSLFLAQSGNVGIGTTNPQAPLTIYHNGGLSTFTGTSYGDAILRAAFNYGETTALDFGTTGSLPIARVGMLYTAAGSSLLFGTSNNFGSGVTNQALMIDPSGNVGVGTTTPGTPLSVTGAAVFTGAVSAPVLYATSTGATSVFSGSITVSGASSLQQATSTNFAVSSIAAGSILKTTTGGALISATPGTDYANFGYLFPGNATTTALAFNGGLTTTNSTTTYATSTFSFAASSLANTAAFGTTGTTTISAAGALSTPSLSVTGAGTSTFTGSVSLLNLNVGGTATTTHNNGINLASGCFAIANNCIGLSMLSGSINLGTQVTGTLGIVNGGTGTTTQVTNGVNYFDGTRVTSGTNLTYNGTLLSVNNGSINVDQFGNYKVAGTAVLSASSTNLATLVGLGAGAALNAAGTYNTAVGWGALALATSTFGDTAVGVQALANAIDTAGAAGVPTNPVNDTAVGTQSLYTNTSGYNNVALGFQSMFSNTIGAGDNAVGTQALYSNVSGVSNNAFGEYALFNNTIGVRNSAVGLSAMHENTSGQNNDAHGFRALYANTTGNNNIAIGRDSFFYNTTGSYNVGVGLYSGIGTTDVTGYSTTTGSDESSVTDNFMTLVGVFSSRDKSVASTTPLSRAGAFGYNAKVGSSNTIALGGLGADAVKVGVSSSTPFAKFSIHTNANEAFPVLFAIASSTANATTTLFSMSNVGTALASGFYNTSGSTGGYQIDGNIILQASSSISSIFVGQGAGAALNASAAGVTVFGFNALHVATSTAGMTAIGDGALQNDIAGGGAGGSQLNTAVGYAALSANTVGYYNTAFGYGASQLNTTGVENTAIGLDSIYNNLTGNGNTGLGFEALLGVAGNSNSENTAVGQFAGYPITTGNNNIILGANTTGTYGPTSGSGNTLIGYNMDLPSHTASNQLDIGNIMYGTSIDGSGTTLSSGNIGIGTTTPASKFTVNGGVTLHGILTGAGAGALCATADGLISYNSGASNCSVSSQRFKNSITPLDATSGLAEILALNPVSFRYNQGVGDSGAQIQVGFIAEQANEVDSRLVVFDASNTPYTFKYENLTAVLTRAIQDIANIAGAFKSKLIAWLGSASNGITDLFALTFNGQKLCLTGSTGRTCVTQEQLAALLAGQYSPTTPPPPASTSTTSTATLVINGNNPVQWQLSSPWQDNLGALFTHDGIAETIYSTSTVDTTQSGTTTLDYWANWYSDPAATSSAQFIHATRSIVVVNPTPNLGNSSSTSTTSTSTAASTTIQ